MAAFSGDVQPPSHSASPTAGTTSRSRARVAATYATRTPSASSRAISAGSVGRQLDRRPRPEPQIARVLRAIDQPVGAVDLQLRGHVGEDDDGELEPFRLVHGHQPHAVAALLENRRFGRLPAVRLLAQLLDEPAERNAAVRLVLPRELGDVQHVGERLLAGVSQHEADVRARRVQQLR